MKPETRPGGQYLWDLAVAGLLLAAALGIGTYRLTESGPIWPDAGRYANAGALFHDWFRSGEWLHPYEFATRNYAQYPAFNVPYHPPAYPALLGVFFLAAGGVSYAAARVFIALCAGVAAICCYLLQRRLGGSREGATAAALLFLTLPEVAQWSRDTLSEIPSLMLILAASYVFVRWLENGRAAVCLLAFVLAEAAFLSRYLSAGVLPAWFLFALLAGKGRSLRSFHLGAAAVLYLLGNLAYVTWSVRFGRYESAADGRDVGYSWQNFTYFTTCLPQLVPPLLAVAAAVGAAVAWRSPRQRDLARFWLAWWFGYTLFKLAMVTSLETRYFLYALPALPGLAAGLFDADALAFRWRPWVARTACGLALAGNLVLWPTIPSGVAGYAAVAECLASQERPGNVLLACWNDQDLIFHYRALRPAVERRMIRADRTLALRIWNFTEIDPASRAHSAEEVLDVLRRGRVRYLVTAAPDDALPDDRLGEMVLAQDVAAASPGQFRRLGDFPVRMRALDRWRDDRVCVWEYLGELPPGPSEIPVRIPTAGMEIRQ